MNSVYEQLCKKIVGRRQEIGTILAAIQAKLPILLVGMPGVSKTTILNAVSHELYGDRPVVQVTGDEQLSAYTLTGFFDPAMVIHDGYKLEYFTPGPLTKAMMQGGILYIEEFNRAPNGALNVLMTALSDDYLEIPRYGRIMAEPGFTLIGSSNPVDDIGTERLSRGLADRFVMVELDYQSEEEEIEIVRRRHSSWGEEWLRFAVYIARETRTHPDLQYGASIRGSIAFLDLLKGWEKPSEEILYSSGTAAFLSKIKVKLSSGRTGADIIHEIMKKQIPTVSQKECFEQWKKSVRAVSEDSSGGALVEAGGADAPALSKGGAVREPSGPSPPVPEFTPQGSGAGGIRGPSKRKPNGIPFLDRQARTAQTAARLEQHRQTPLIPIQEVEYWMERTKMVIREGEWNKQRMGGVRLSSRPWEPAVGGEVDVESTMNQVLYSSFMPQSQDIQMRYRSRMKKNFIVFIDHSGSMAGSKLIVSAVLAGALAHLGAREQCRYGVYAFDQEVSELKHLHQALDVKSVIEEILHLPEGRSTDLSQTFSFAAGLLDSGEDAEVIFVSDCMPTRGEKMFHSLNQLAQKIPSLAICYLNSKGGAEFDVETAAGTHKLDLYGLWGYKWAGAERFFVLNQLEDLPHVVNLLLGHKGGVLV